MKNFRKQIDEAREAQTPAERHEKTINLIDDLFAEIDALRGTLMNLSDADTLAAAPGTLKKTATKKA